jgi:chemotaxis protein CheD
LKSHATIHAGDYLASKEPVTIKTVLGSCVAVCLFDRANGIGGMNHYMLPEGPPGVVSARYGSHAMDLLIGRIQQLGGRRANLVAKVFGAAHVLRVRSQGVSVPVQNAEFVLRFLEDEEIPIIAKDIGGKTPRRVIMQSWSGRVFVHRLPEVTLVDEAPRSEEAPGFLQFFGS